MNSINIQSTVLVSKQKKYKNILKQNCQKANFEDDNINVLPTEGTKPENNSIDHKPQEIQEDGEGTDLSGSSTIEFVKKEIIKTESPFDPEEKRSYTQKDINQSLISINPIKKSS